jgi:cytochrome d ubiquinol oxidase subunit I
METAKAAFKVALPVFVIFSILQVPLFGAEQAVEVATYQPVKLAAMEGLWETQSCAPMFIVGWVDTASQTTKGISIPCLLSFLAYGDIDATVQGLKSFPPDTWAPVNLTFQVYHLMINFGMVFIGIGLLATLFAAWKQRIWRTRWVLWILVVSIFLTELATLAGWWTAEFGRQPWIVWELMRTAEGVSPNLAGGQVFLSVLMFVALYALLFVLFIYLLNEKIQHGPEPLEDEVPVSSLPDTFRDVFRRGTRA